MVQHCALGAARAVPAQGTVDARVLNLGRGICASGALLFARVWQGGCGWGTWTPFFKLAQGGTAPGGWVLLGEQAFLQDQVSEIFTRADAR